MSEPEKFTYVQDSHVEERHIGKGEFECVVPIKYPRLPSQWRERLVMVTITVEPR